MLNKLKPKSEFSRNVLTLMTGTTIAQAIPIAISPILTRLYTPEDFGVFALYMSLASILSIIATGRYELAIMLPKRESDALNIVALSMFIVIVVSLIVLSIILIFNSEIATLLGKRSISILLYFLPITIFLTGLYQSVYYFLNRSKRYKSLAYSKVIQNGSTSASNLLFGFYSSGSMWLVLSTVIGRLLSTIYLTKPFIEISNIKNSVTSLKVVQVAKEYSKFPKFDLLASFFNVASLQMISILFNLFFGSLSAGYYFLTQRVLSVPVSLVSASILDVFKERSAKDYENFGNAREIYKNTFLKLFIISFIPSIILYFYSVELFTFVFGKEWAVSGEYTKVLIPMLFTRFISSPLSFMIYIGQKQEINLYGNMLLFCLSLLSFYFANSAYESVVYISISFSFVYILYIFISAKIAKVI